MNRSIFSTSLTVGCFLLLSMGNAGAWTIEQSYDNENVGARCNQWSASQSVVSNDESASGTKSCKQSITEGEAGFGKWGGVIKFPSKLHPGDELWIRIRTFFPNGFIYTTPGGHRLKFLRVHTYTSTGDNVGYDDWYLNRDGNSEPFSFIYEGRLDKKWNHVGTSADKIKRGTWETYEFYLKFDTASINEGGTSRMRAWKNGVLLKDMSDMVTMKNQSNYADSINIFTYWNGKSPQTQSMYVDDLFITNQRPQKTDAFGNPFIGTGGFVAAQQPLPPLLAIK